MNQFLILFIGKNKLYKHCIKRMTALVQTTEIDYYGILGVTK